MSSRCAGKIKLPEALVPLILKAVQDRWIFCRYFMNVKGKLCLVVGGGEVATRKAGVLLDAGATCAWLHPRSNRNWPGNTASSLSLHVSRRSISTAYYWSSLPPTTASVNRQVSELAQARNLPVNVVDDPELCSFIMPAILDRSPLMVAFSSGGASPVLTRLMRGKLETIIPQNYSRLAAFAERFRETGQGSASPTRPSAASSGRTCLKAWSPRRC